MPKKKYFLDKEKTESLELSWKGGYREVTVAYNGQIVTTLSRDKIIAGETIELPNGQSLEIKLSIGLFAVLTTKINGKHVPGSMGDPLYQLRQIFILLLVLGALNIVLGLLFESSDVQIEGLESVGYMNIAIGLVYIALGYAVTRGSLAALIAVCLFFLSDLVLAAMYSDQSGTHMVLYVKVFFIIFVVRGFRYMKEYRTMKKEL